MTARKRTYDLASGGCSDRNSLYDTYHKMSTLKAGIKPNAGAKPSLRNFPHGKTNPNIPKAFNTYNTIAGQKPSIDSTESQSKTVGFSILNADNLNEPSTKAVSPRALNESSITPRGFGQGAPASNFKSAAKANAFKQHRRQK